MNAKICRLCLQTINNNNCHTIEESLLKSLKLNINISKENVMCSECANCLRVFSKFTSGCFYMGNGMLPSYFLENDIKLDPELMVTASNPKSCMKTEIKCSFCKKTHEGQDLISLEESKEYKFMVNMLEQYISETNLKNTEELLTCATCLEALQGGLSVILKCLEVEEKIRKYIELEGTDDKGQIELKKVQQFKFRPILKLKIESVGVNKLEDRRDQIKEEYATIAKTEIKYEKEISYPELIIKTEDDDIKTKESDCDITDIKSIQNDCEGFQEPFIENRTLDDPLHMSVVISETRKSKDCIKQHLLTHKSPPGIKMFKCAMCSYAANHKSHLKDHLLTHKSPLEIKMFKCELCPYETKRKRVFKIHLLIHKSPSEIKMFKCELCLYMAKRKCHLKQHLLTHQSPSEIKMFKCELCSYEAKQNSHLKKHLFIHKSPSEIKMFKCEMCPYETKRKRDLENHLLIHKSPSEIKMLKCYLCSYEAKQKSTLKKHILSHKSPSKIEMFKCALCSYEGTHKSYLKIHLLTHKSPSEIKMFKCELCPYEAKRKDMIKSHLLCHRSPLGIQMFKCEMCPYEAKRKIQLRSHLLLNHKDLSEKKMYQCDSCSFCTKYKGSIRRHKLTHKLSLLK